MYEHLLTAEGVVGPVEHFRCVVCWRSVPWSQGCADRVDREVSAAVRQRIYVDRYWISDGGICNDCWFTLGGDDIHVSRVDDQEEVPSAAGDLGDWAIA